MFGSSSPKLKDIPMYISGGKREFSKKFFKCIVCPKHRLEIGGTLCFPKVHVVPFCTAYIITPIPRLPQYFVMYTPLYID